MKQIFLTEQVNYLLLEYKLQQISAIDVFKNIVDLIRPSKNGDHSSAEKKINDFGSLLNTHPELKQIFAAALTQMVGNANQTELFTHVTALSRKSFFGELRKLLLFKLLPPVEDSRELGVIIRSVFNEKKDFEWLALIDDRSLAIFMQDAGIIPPGKLATDHYIIQELLDDTQLLSQIITALSVDTEIIKNFDELLTRESPFNQLHLAVTSWADKVRLNMVLRNNDTPLYLEILERRNDCENFVTKMHDLKNVNGTSLHLTIVLQKLSKCLKRLQSLMNLLVHHSDEKNYDLLAQFCKTVVKVESQKYSIRYFFNETISTLAFQITEHTGKTGEHYITDSAKEYATMFFNALKGGFVISFMVILKYLISVLKLPVLQDTLLKGINYSFGFVGIHLWHGVVATKQPAMTASTIAQSIESSSTVEEIKELGNVILKVCRSQFAAVMGNLLMVFPCTFLIAYAYFYFTGKPLMPIDEAHHKFDAVNPIHSLALFHAAIAGVMLFVSGILSGLADNGNLFNNYSGRIQRSRLIRKIFGEKGAMKAGNYIANNTGSLTGNFSLGFLLAFVAFIGYITGLPLDIQHVTFATGNLGFAAAHIYDHLTLKEIWIALAGIIGIGLINIGVSFTLTMIVAIKSRGIDLNLTPGLMGYVVKQFFKNPLLFFFPPKKGA